MAWKRKCANSDIFFHSHGFSIYQSSIAIFSYLSKHVTYECEILNTISGIFSILTTETDTSAIVTWHHCCNFRTIQGYKVWISDILDQGWRTYGTQKDFLGTRHSLLSQLFLFLWHNRCLYIVKIMCKYTRTSDGTETVYELPLLPNNTVGEIFLCKSGVVWSVDWIFIIGVLAWQWMGEYVISDNRFYSPLFKQEEVAAPVTSTFSSLLHSLGRPMLDT